MKIAIIPARGGSKRIPHKNTKMFLGKPMIAWAIETAQRSKVFDHVIVSTDDDEIASIAVRFGAKVPFRRPAELSDDLTPTVPVIAHAVQACSNLGWQSEAVCCLYPCAVTTQIDDLSRALQRLIETGSDYVYPVTDYVHPIQRAMRQLSHGQMQFFQPEFELTRTQDLEKAYHDAGQFYWGKASAWLEHKKMHSSGIGMVVPHWRVVDIDTEDDWVRAELLVKALLQHRSDGESK